jgi:hypothetical protein
MHNAKGAKQMKLAEFGRDTLSSCVAVAMLAGCGGSQPPIGAPVAMPQSRAVAMHAERGGSWMLPEAKAGPTYQTTGPLLYVTNFTYNTVTVYHANARNLAPIATISDGLNVPSGDCLDSLGTLYVTNEPISGPGWVSEYPLGKTTPSKVVTNGMNTPGNCAIDSKGNLWVTNIGGPNVTEYLFGSKKPAAKITKGLVYPVGIAIDHFGNLYVSNRLSEYSGNVVVYLPGSKSPARTITDGVASPVGIAVDSTGALYVTNIVENNVEEYRSGRSHPYRMITQAMNGPTAVTVNKKGWLYVANYGNNIVVEFPPGPTTPSRRQISKGVYTPEGVALHPPLLP